MTRIIRSPWARVALGLILLIIVLSAVDVSEMTLSLDRRAWMGILAAVVALLAGAALSAWRWRLVLGPAGPVYGFLLRLYFIGWFCSLFLPTAVGGDAVRAVGLVQGGTPSGAALSSILLERMLGLVAMLMYLAAGAVLAPALLARAADFAYVEHGARQLLWIGAGLLLAGLLGIYLVRKIDLLRGTIRDALHLLVALAASPGRAAAATAVSVLVQLAYVLTWFALAAGFQLDVPLVPFLIFVPLVSLAAMLPVTISGLGVREGVWAVLLTPFAVVPADAVAYSLVYYLCTLLIGLIGGVAFMTSGLSRGDLTTERREDAGRASRRRGPEPIEGG